MTPIHASVRQGMAGLVLAAILCGALAAAAQTPLPTPRDEREPNPAALREAERAAGIAPGSGAAQQTRTLEQMEREMTGQAPNAAGPPGALPPNNPAAEARSENQLFRELTGQNPNAPVAPR